jgi:hypothetical protein
MEQVAVLFVFLQTYATSKKMKVRVIHARFEVFMAGKIHVEVFWAVTPCGVVAGYQHFGGHCCLHLQGEDGNRKHGMVMT